MISATSIELFENLAQYEYNSRYYDFHNDYDCTGMTYSDGVLSIQFKSSIDGVPLSLRFKEVEIIAFDFFNVKDVEGLTLDNLYRGRTEFNGELIEVSKNDKGYFYLEFYESQKLEFWANSVSIE